MQGYFLKFARLFLLGQGREIGEGRRMLSEVNKVVD